MQHPLNNRANLDFDFGISNTTSPRSIAGSAVCIAAVCRCFMADMLLLDEVTCPASIGFAVRLNSTWSRLTQRLL